MSVITLALMLAPLPAMAQLATLPAIIEPDAKALPVARELLTIMFPPADREQLFNKISDTMIANMMTGARQADIMDARTSAVIDRFMADIQKDCRTSLNQSMPSLFEIYARAYARHFSADELRDIEGFVKTPAGIKFVQRGSMILTDPDVGKWQGDQFADQMKRLAPKIDKMNADIAALKKSEGAKQ